LITSDIGKCIGSVLSLPTILHHSLTIAAMIIIALIMCLGDSDFLTALALHLIYEYGYHQKDKNVIDHYFSGNFGVTTWISSHPPCIKHPLALVPKMPTLLNHGLVFIRWKGLLPFQDWTSITVYSHYLQIWYSYDISMILLLYITTVYLSIKPYLGSKNYDLAIIFLFMLVCKAITIDYVPSFFYYISDSPYRFSPQPPYLGALTGAGFTQRNRSWPYLEPQKFVGATAAVRI